MSEPPREVRVDHTELNHATLSRADMAGKVISGQPHEVVDMTGRTMTLQSITAATIVAATGPLDELELAPPPEPLAPPEEPPQTTPEGVTYTYGVPERIAEAEQARTDQPTDRSLS